MARRLFRHTAGREETGPGVRHGRPPPSAGTFRFAIRRRARPLGRRSDPRPLGPCGRQRHGPHRPGGLRQPGYRSLPRGPAGQGAQSSSWRLGDLFAERMETSLKDLTKYADLKPKIDVPAERMFAGFDAYQKVLASGVDLVLFATPPHFRPLHYAAAVKAGKHVFMEKPLCVDAPGYRMLVAANEEARKKLSVVVGLQRPPLAGIPRWTGENPRWCGRRRGVRSHLFQHARRRTGRRTKPEGDGRDGIPDPPLGHLPLALRRSPRRAGDARDRRGQLGPRHDHPVRAVGMGAAKSASGPGGDIWTITRSSSNMPPAAFLPGPAAGRHLDQRFR